MFYIGFIFQGQRMILNPGDSYQTVTIVPSDTNPGEVSYVLIVQQPEDEKDEEEEEDDKNEDQDLTVYDFDEAEDGGTTMVIFSFSFSKGFDWICMGLHFHDCLYVTTHLSYRNQEMKMTKLKLWR